MKNRYWTLAVGIIIGIIAFGIIEIWVAKYEKSDLVDEVMAELDAKKFQLAVTSSNKDNGMISYIKWWYHEKEEKYYLFLPGSWENGGNTELYWIFSTVEEILLNDKKILNGDVFYIDSGNYIVIAAGKKYNVVILYSSDIPSLFIETQSGKLDYIHESKENIESAKYVLYDEKGKLNNNGAIAKMFCRGNSSFSDAEKKSYHLDLSEKSRILDLGEEKDWLLIGSDVDRTLSRNKIVNSLAKELSMEYVPDMQYVDLFANGEYLGNYLLTEKIEIGSDRVNIRDLEKETELGNPGLDFSTCENVIEDPNKLFSRKWWKIPNEPADYTGGYLLEIELSDRYGLEPSGFITSRMQAVVVNSPKYATLNQIGYIADIYQDFEDAVFSETGYNKKTGKYFYEYIDIDSFAIKYMVEELVKNLDASYTSCFLYKPEYDTKIYAGPVWDYDMAINVGATTNEGIDLEEPEGLYVAYSKKDSDLWYALYKQQYFKKHIDTLCNNRFEETTRKFIETKIDANTKLIMNSGVMNSIRWDKIEGENPEEIKEIFIEVNNELKDFLYKRLQWLIKEWEYNE